MFMGIPCLHEQEIMPAEMVMSLGLIFHVLDFLSEVDDLSQVNPGTIGHGVLTLGFLPQDFDRGGRVSLDYSG
jgi:hypothetical protein